MARPFPICLILSHLKVPRKTGNMHDGGVGEPAADNRATSWTQLQQRIDALAPDQIHRRIFLTTYQRTTHAVGEAVNDAYFEDPDWVVRWDVAFAELFIVAHDDDQAGRPVPRPWRLAFQADPDLPTIVHLLLGHECSHQLRPAAGDTVGDHRSGFRGSRADRSGGVVIMNASIRSWPAEWSRKITRSAVARSVLDRLLTPANRLSSRRFLREARQKVWLNVAELQQARLDGR